jgi:peptidyl-prolyl cis-trans isomerase C
MKWALREPLLHFLLIGGALFAAYAAFHRATAPALAGLRIEITDGDVGQLRHTWQVQWKRPPTKVELEGLIVGEIRERVLSQEAVKLGLDRDDVIVRRRLAQKLEFLLQDVAALREPTEDELVSYFTNNRIAYTVPARLTLTQIYFSAAKPDAEQNARSVLHLLQRGGTEVTAADVGDPFLLDAELKDMLLPEIERTFGREFSTAAATLAVGDWQGPVRSTYGWHVVKVTARADAGVPTLAEVREKVKQDWSEKQRRRANDEVFERIASHYVVVVQGQNQFSTPKFQPVASRDDAR